MGDRTGIAWTDMTWNPVRGCTRVSAGCENCYAEREARRHSHPGGAYEGLVRAIPSGGAGLDPGSRGYRPPNKMAARWTGKIRLVPEKLDEPLRKRKPRRIFVDSMGDLFHEGVPDEFIDKVFAISSLAPQHTLQVLTKRGERMRDYFASPYRFAFIEGEAQAIYAKRTGEDPSMWLAVQDLPNVQLGVSVEDQKTADERIPLLLQTPAAVRFVSLEPLLERIELRRRTWWTADGTRHTAGPHLEGIHWAIVGGESGPGARPCDVEWIRYLVRQCREAKVPVFVKQMGSQPVLPVEDRTRWGANFRYELRLPLRDRKGADPAEWPKDLRVQEFPGG